MILEHDFICSRCGWRVYAPLHHGAPTLCTECQYVLTGLAAAGAAPFRPIDRCLWWGIGITAALWALMIGLVMAMVAHL
jgi:hypothetical protein